MPTILIADAYKSSLVMTSEVFKDKISGATIYIARNGEDCIALAQKYEFDMVVVDFDLPDTDGIHLCKLLRKDFEGPILLTAFPDKQVIDAIEKDLFAYHDAADWIKKPVSVERLGCAIDKYLLNKQRVRKRYSSQLEALIVGKGAGRGKRAPKVSGNVINLSVGGALVNLDQQVKMKVGEEVAFNLFLDPGKGSERETTAISKKKNSKDKKDCDTHVKTSRPKSSTKIKAVIAWADKGKKQAGLNFEHISDSHRKLLEAVLRKSDEIDG